MKQIPFILTLVFCCTFIGFANLYEIDFKQEETQPIPPSNSIKLFTFGYTETIGDSFWIRLIQGFHGCEQNRGGSDLDENGVRMGINRTPSCNYSWSYYMLSLVLDLIPRFYYAARVGPVILSVVVDDINGATRLFEKVLRLYPDDWVIASRAGYHYVFELEDYGRGAALYLQASKLGGPAWMALYSAKLSDKDGRRVYAQNILKDFLSSRDLKPEEREQFEKKLKQLIEAK